jgi:hypothetical protein
MVDLQAKGAYDTDVGAIQTDAGLLPARVSFTARASQRPPNGDWTDGCHVKLNVAAWQLADATFASKRRQGVHAWLQKIVAIFALEIRASEQWRRRTASASFCSMWTAHSPLRVRCAAKMELIGYLTLECLCDL